VAASGVLALWSRYLDRHGERPADAYGWFNTVTGVVGVRYHQGPGRAFVDATFSPSPVPDQSGRTNYVDSDRAGGAAGCDWRVSVLGGSLRAGVQVQAHRLLARETRKLMPPAGTAGAPPLVVDEVPDEAVVAGQPLAGREGLQTNNPGWPGFSSAGWIVGGGVNLSLSF
jgi:hypothetical protein